MCNECLAPFSVCEWVSWMWLRGLGSRKAEGFSIFLERDG